MEVLSALLASEEFQTILGIALTAALGWAAAEFRRRTGVELSRERRDALHSAIQTGIASALKDGRIDARDWHALRAHVIAHIANGGAPDALENLPHDDSTIDNLIVRYAPTTSKGD